MGGQQTSGGTRMSVRGAATRVPGDGGSGSSLRAGRDLSHPRSARLHRCAAASGAARLPPLRGRASARRHRAERTDRSDGHRGAQRPLRRRSRRSRRARRARRARRRRSRAGDHRRAGLRVVLGNRPAVARPASGGAARHAPRHSPPLGAGNGMQRGRSGARPGVPVGGSAARAVPSWRSRWRSPRCTIRSRSRWRTWSSPRCSPTAPPPQSSPPIARPAPTLVDTASYSDYRGFDYISSHLTDRGFQGRMTVEVPDAIESQVGPFVDGLLQRNGLTRSQVAHWCFHPGGPKILEGVQRALGLTRGRCRALVRGSARLREHVLADGPVRAAPHSGAADTAQRRRRRARRLRARPDLRRPADALVSSASGAASHRAGGIVGVFSLRMPRRFLRGGRARFALTVLALAIGVALVFAVDLANRAVESAFVAVIDTMAGRAALFVSAGGDGHVARGGGSLARAGRGGRARRAGGQRRGLPR